MINSDPIANEQSLIEACVRGEKASMKRLYDMYRERIFSTCVRMLRSVEDAEDALQDTFIRAFRYLPGFKGESSLSTWLYRIAVNICIEKLRKRGREGETVTIEDYMGECVASTSTDGSTERFNMIVEREIQKLPRGCKTVFVLHAIEGFKHEEIAHMLEISSGTSKSQYYQARERLRKNLLPYLEELRYEVQ